MDVYSLVGKSGTGKSFQALSLCAQLGIESIIDDGLFIVSGHILAGESAKRQETKIRAVKTALFTDPILQEEVMRQIEKEAPKSILVIGTSERMIAQICQRLSLPQPSVPIHIESLTTREERDTARKQRYEMGQHIIPAPTLQIKKDFSGYFLHPLRQIRNDFDELFDVWSAAPERSVVRPTYSYMGKYSISDKAIMDIVTLAGTRTPGVGAIPLIFIKKRKEGIIIDMGVVMECECAILPAARKLQELVAGDVESMTSLNILAVDIQIKSLKRKDSKKMTQNASVEMIETASDAKGRLNNE